MINEMATLCHPWLLVFRDSSRKPVPSEPQPSRREFAPHPSLFQEVSILGGAAK
jgi:hypothetical protein